MACGTDLSSLKLLPHLCTALEGLCLSPVFELQKSWLPSSTGDSRPLSPLASLDYREASYLVAPARPGGEAATSSSRQLLPGEMEQMDSPILQESGEQRALEGAREVSVLEAEKQVSCLPRDMDMRAGPGLWGVLTLWFWPRQPLEAVCTASVLYPGAPRGMVAGASLSVQLWSCACCLITNPAQALLLGVP